MSLIRKCACFVFSTLILASSLALPQLPASANSELIITVNSTEDLPDSATNSVCSANQPSGGPCTLRGYLRSKRQYSVSARNHPDPAWHVRAKHTP